MPVKSDHRYSPQEIAEILKISKSTLLRIEREGKIPKFKRYEEGNKKGWRYATEKDLIKLKAIFKKHKRV